jgi:hypothetical protein
MTDDQPWLVVGDFNLIRRLENRNKLGGPKYDDGI